MFEEIFLLVSATALLLGSPGPAPLALAATSASFGVRQTLPFLSGILAGLLIVIILSALGFSALLDTRPVVKTALQVAGGIYIFFIAYKIVFKPVSLDKTKLIAPSMTDGFILNLINPKAYAAIFALLSQFGLSDSSVVLGYLKTGFLCLLVAAIVDVAWVVFGATLSHLMASENKAKILRISFAMLMIFAVVVANLSIS